MKTGFITFMTLWSCVLLCAAARGQSADESGDMDSVVWLTDSKCTTRIENYDSLIECRFNFGGGKVPQYYYEINSKAKQVLITMVHARCGKRIASDSIQPVNVGPVRVVHFREDLQNKNQDMKVMLPVLYYVTTVTIDCDPIVTEQGMAIRDDGKTVFLDFKWPSSKRKRSKMYDIPRPLYKIFMVSLATAVVAGLAAGGYYYYKHYYKKSKSDPLDPVLPEHPVP